MKLRGITCYKSNFAKRIMSSLDPVVKDCDTNNFLFQVQTVCDKLAPSGATFVFGNDGHPVP